MDQRLDFAQRLREAMQDAGLQARPGVLLNHFNARYWGRSVSFQAVSRWLRGEAFPTQEKLVVLAEMLNVRPEVLRYGEAVRKAVAERSYRWETRGGFLEQETFDLFLRLPPAQRKLIRETILCSRAPTPASPSARPAHRPRARPWRWRGRPRCGPEGPIGEVGFGGASPAGAGRATRWRS
jgi:transcriptional regulator with XRE-family HTH domain